MEYDGVWRWVSRLNPPRNGHKCKISVFWRLRAQSTSILSRLETFAENYIINSWSHHVTCALMRNFLRYFCCLGWDMLCTKDGSVSFFFSNTARVQRCLMSRYLMALFKYEVKATSIFNPSLVWRINNAQLHAIGNYRINRNCRVQDKSLLGFLMQNGDDCMPMEL